MSSKKYVLLSIKPQYAKLIKEGSKTIELRTKIPKLSKGDSLIFYETSPVQKVTFTAEVDEVIVSNPEHLWKQHHDALGLSKQLYDDYFNEREFAYGLLLRGVTVIQPASLDSVFGKETSPPQGFRYLSNDEYKLVARFPSE